mmetsp:Transcript_7435/g.18220  ORF Transcript_7435/g.18220 Transcript_7435/m.18220 type:complete len:250 (-) Transcript_7435:546-1295(-)
MAKIPPPSVCFKRSSNSSENPSGPHKQASFDFVVVVCCLSFSPPPCIIKSSINLWKIAPSYFFLAQRPKKFVHVLGTISQWSSNNKGTVIEGVLFPLFIFNTKFTYPFFPFQDFMTLKRRSRISSGVAALESLVDEEVAEDVLVNPRAADPDVYFTPVTSSVGTTNGRFDPGTSKNVFSSVAAMDEAAAAFFCFARSSSSFSFFVFWISSITRVAVTDLRILPLLLCLLPVLDRAFRMCQKLETSRTRF